MAKSEAWFQIFFVFLVVLNPHFLIWVKLFKHFSTFVVDYLFSLLEILCFCLMQYLFSYSFLAKSIRAYPCKHMTTSPIKQKLLEKAIVLKKELTLVQSVKSSQDYTADPSETLCWWDERIPWSRSALSWKGESYQSHTSPIPINGTFPLNDCSMTSCI